MTETMTSTASVSVPRIRSLPGVLSNQIAAGEVIERPASVVKELIENSFDAGARRIQIEVEAGGVGLVRVRDDGCGIHADDLKLALSRHATSKIASLSDLERVRSFGFRGEALPSIASVSRLTLASRTASADSGFEVNAEGALADPIRPAALPPGTRVSVRDLFFNTPARRKFLRTERTEFRHLEDVVKRAALSRFDVGLSFHHNGKEVLRLSPALEAEARAARVARVLGQAFAQRALTVDVEGVGMTLKGWVGAADAARAHPDTQYFFINGRAVRDSTARHALRQAFGDRLASGRHPAYVLYLDLDPAQVDVNVHPAKHEVRYRQSRLVHDFLWRGLARSLDPAHAPSLASAAESAAPSNRPDAATSAFNVPPAGRGSNVAEWHAVYGAPGKVETTSDIGFRGAGSAALIAGRYAASVDTDGIAVIDLAAARRRLILRALGPGSDENEGVSRPLLVPMSIPLEEAKAERLQSRLQAFADAGFDLRRSAPASMTLRAVPACLAHVPASGLVETILRWVESRSDSGVETLAEALARAGGDQLQDLARDPDAVSALVRFARTHAGDGSPPLMVRLDAAAIADLMKR